MNLMCYKIIIITYQSLNGLMKKRSNKGGNVLLFHVNRKSEINGTELGLLP